jgi:hypothetical protein
MEKRAKTENDRGHRLATETRKDEVQDIGDVTSTAPNPRPRMKRTKQIGRGEVTDIEGDTDIAPHHGHTVRMKGERSADAGMKVGMKKPTRLWIPNP